MCSMRCIFYVLIIAALVLVGTAAAAPVLPGEFYGAVLLNGNPAPAGTVIIAQINGEPRGQLTTTVDGQYGGPGNFDPRLIVTSTEEEVNAGNVTITFLVGGVQAFQVSSFKSGNSEKLDLLANSKAFGTSVTTAVPAYASAGGASGGSGASGGGGGGGYAAPSSGTGTGSSPVIPVKGTSTVTPATTGTGPSVTANINAQQNASTVTVISTAGVTQAPAVTTIPTTKKAGAGPLSIVFLITSIIAVLVIVGRNRDTGKRR